MDTTRQDLDRLYQLLPEIYRIRDADQGYPLKAFLRIIAEQVNVVERDIAQLYENWFIETAEEWVVPYIGDLIGYRPVYEAGEPGDILTAQDRERNQKLVPRSDVANTMYYRRRKGIAALLELLAIDVAGWPARAVEFFQLLAWIHNINHLHLERARTLDLRAGDALDLLDGPFDHAAHTVDVRRINSHRRSGYYNIPSVGVYVWRLRPYRVTASPAFCLEEVGPHCYTFSALGNDSPLFNQSEPDLEPLHIAEANNLPVPIRRRPFERRPETFYGQDKSLEIWVGSWAQYDTSQALPVEAIQAADLSDWQYRPGPDQVAVDPERGRIAFPPDQLPKRVRVTYHYAFSADLGGGEYDRKLVQPSSYRLYRVGENEPFRNLSAALNRWKLELSTWDTTEPQNAVIEIADSGVYVEPIHVALQANQSLQIRAANQARPVIRLLNWETDLPDSLSVTMAGSSRFSLDGLLITGRAVHIRAEPPAAGEPRDLNVCPAEVSIRHCTLVPGWGLQNTCEPRRPAEPSLELFNVRARVRIAHSIIGSIQVNENQVDADPIPLDITDSILDAAQPDGEALGAPGRPVAHAVLTIKRCTVFGVVAVHAIELAEDTIFNNCLNVARRQLGGMRFCYVPRVCRTPRRYGCQPDLAEQAATNELRQLQASPSPAAIEAAQARARTRVQPQFTSIRYGTPGYCQLAATCAPEIVRGAADESEMGVFHDLYQPQRAVNLRARLEEHLPAGMQAGIVYVT